MLDIDSDGSIVISATALGLLFNLIFLYNGGMLNQLLLGFGWVKEAIDWKSEKYYMFTMLLPVMWQYVGFYFVILVTGLNNISPELYEAAAIDGASGLQRVTRITLRQALQQLQNEGHLTARKGLVANFRA